MVGGRFELKFGEEVGSYGGIWREGFLGSRDS